MEDSLHTECNGPFNMLDIHIHIIYKIYIYAAEVIDLVEKEFSKRSENIVAGRPLTDEEKSKRCWSPCLELRSIPFHSVLYLAKKT